MVFWRLPSTEHSSCSYNFLRAKRDWFKTTAFPFDHQDKSKKKKSLKQSLFSCISLKHISNTPVCFWLFFLISCVFSITIISAIVQLHTWTHCYTGIPMSIELYIWTFEYNAIYQSCCFYFWLILISLQQQIFWIACIDLHRSPTLQLEYHIAYCWPNFFHLSLTHIAMISQGINTKPWRQSMNEGGLDRMSLSVMKSL